MRAALFAAALALCACGSSTEGRIVRARIAVEAQPEPERAPGEFETRTGWSVTLERAEIALSAVYAFAPEEAPSVMAALSRALVPVARAHGGHDPLSGKRVRAEWLEPVVVDALDAERRELGEVEAEAGAVASLAVDIAEPESDVTSELDGRQVWVAGEARRGAATIRFEGGVRIPDDGLTRRIETRVDAVELDEGVTLVVGARPSVWLRDAEFDRLAETEDGEARAITQDSQVGRALYVGARSPAALSMHVIREEEHHD